MRIEEKIKILLNIKLVKKTKEIFFITPPPSDLFSKKNHYKKKIKLSDKLK